METLKKQGSGDKEKKKSEVEFRKGRMMAARGWRLGEMSSLSKSTRWINSDDVLCSMAIKLTILFLKFAESKS